MRMNKTNVVHYHPAASSTSLRFSPSSLLLKKSIKEKIKANPERLNKAKHFW
jgi:hypothetical protein